MSTTVELGKATAEIARLRAGIRSLAAEVEGYADSLAITYQNPDHRRAATGPHRLTAAKLRALLDES